MRRLLLYLCCVVFLTASDTAEERIAWNDSYKLTWADFKGTPRSGNVYVASTSSGLSFSYGFKTINGQPTSDFTYEVTAYFYPQNSWYDPTRVSPRVLQHEQTHFDITELHARLLRMRIAEFNFTTNVKEELDALYDQVERERRAMQSQYDLESDHSVIRDREAAWVARVQEMLKQTEAWSQ
ncbi:DUF922 domain-containing protein [Gilvibacter sp.]|uniref:DUF922 domain-containing protein n=1 Tax=Gilvibacter sp. TaxID=2729997 RepID=UPI0035BE84F6